MSRPRKSQRTVEPLRTKVARIKTLSIPTAVLLADKAQGGALTDADLALYVRLHLWSGSSKFTWVGTETVAETFKKPPRTVRQQLRNLAKAGWISREERYVAKVGGTREGWVIRGETKNDAASYAATCGRITGNLLPRNRQPIATEAIPDEAPPGNLPGPTASVSGSLPQAPGSASKISREDPETTEETSEGKKVHAPAPLPLDLGNKPLPLLIATPPLRKTTPKTRDAVWPPEDSTDVYAKWGSEMSLANPGYVVPRPGVKELSICKLLVDRFESPQLEAVIRVAVWDWEAIQQSVEVWYTKSRPIPEVQCILKISAQLAAFVETGVVSTARRVSRYRAKYVDPPVVVGERKPGELSPAAQVRAAWRVKQDAAKEAKKLRDAERWAPRTSAG